MLFSTTHVNNEIVPPDSQAAFELIASSHPAADPALGDAAFLARLETARRHVAERLPLVKDAGGHAALMRGLAADFGDGHIWSRPVFAPVFRKWAGMLLVRRGAAWIVGSQGALPGARLVSCDGVAAEDWARPRVADFHGDPAIEAQIAKTAPELLLDERNPFVTLPTRCTFRKDGHNMPLDLAWRRMEQAEFEKRVREAQHSAKAGMRAKPFDGGWWIGMETMSNRAEEMLARVEENLDAVRAAPLVVVDVRGNSGGNSAYGDWLARLLVGKKSAGRRRFRNPIVSTPIGVFRSPISRGSTIYGRESSRAAAATPFTRMSCGCCARRCRWAIISLRRWHPAPRSSRTKCPSHQIPPVCPPAR